jgi:hypothetical protein
MACRGWVRFTPAIRLQVGQIQTGVDNLPVGRIYSSGHGFVPSINADTFAQLTELSNVPPATGLPTNWEDIKEGHLVIAREEAVVREEFPSH